MSNDSDGSTDTLEDTSKDEGTIEVTGSGARGEAEYLRGEEGNSDKARKSRTEKQPSASQGEGDDYSEGIASGESLSVRVGREDDERKMVASSSVATPQKEGPLAGKLSRYRDYSRVPASEPSSVASIFRAASTKDPPFPVKLHAMLSNKDFESIISWLPHGRSWRILKPENLEDRVLPLYFSHGRLSSFMRQVNGWGFIRVKHGPDYNSYYNELFLRGLPHLMERMRRVAVSTKFKGGQSEDDPVPDFYKISGENPVPESKPPPHPSELMRGASSKLAPQPAKPIATTSYSGTGQAQFSHVGDFGQLRHLEGHYSALGGINPNLPSAETFPGFGGAASQMDQARLLLLQRMQLQPHAFNFGRMFGEADLGGAFASMGNPMTSSTMSQVSALHRGMDHEGAVYTPLEIARWNLLRAHSAAFGANPNQFPAIMGGGFGPHRTHPMAGATEFDAAASAMMRQAMPSMIQLQQSGLFRPGQIPAQAVLGQQLPLPPTEAVAAFPRDRTMMSAGYPTGGSVGDRESHGSMIPFIPHGGQAQGQALATRDDRRPKSGEKEEEEEMAYFSNPKKRPSR